MEGECLKVLDDHGGGGWRGYILMVLAKGGGNKWSEGNP